MDRDHTCVCGRPLRLTETGHIVANIFSCGREECKKKLAPKPPNKIEPAPIAQPFTGDEVPFDYWDNWDRNQLQRHLMRHSGD